MMTPESEARRERMNAAISPFQAKLKYILPYDDAKAMLDEYAEKVIGRANLDRRDEELNFEIDVLYIKILMAMMNGNDWNKEYEGQEKPKRQFSLFGIRF